MPPARGPAASGMGGIMSTPSAPWPLPERPDLDQLRKQAKELRATENHPTLTAAQLALARRYGYASWTKLKLAVEQAQLRHAINDGDAARVRALLDASRTLVRTSFSDGSTPLHVAVETNRTDIVEIIARHGAPLGARYAKSAHSALSWALTVEAIDAARTLVALGSE